MDRPSVFVSQDHNKKGFEIVQFAKDGVSTLNFSHPNYSALHHDSSTDEILDHEEKSPMQFMPRLPPAVLQMRGTPQGFEAAKRQGNAISTITSTFG